MRVVFVSHNSQAGGAERAMLELIDGLREQGVVCSVLLREKGWLVEELNRRNLPFAVIPYRWWCSTRPYWKQRLPNFLALVMVLPVLMRIRRWKADVVLTNTSVIAVGALAAMLLRKRHIWYIHEFGKEDHDLSFDLGISLASKLMARLSAFVIVNSRTLEAFYARRISRPQLRMIYQAVEMHDASTLDQASETRPALAATRHKLVLVGGIEEGKGQTDAVQALGHLKAQGVQAELTLVGSGELAALETLRRSVSRCGLEGLVHFAGQVSDPAPIVKDSDIALICSRSEAFGRSTVEAMKLGKPVIGARGGATPELIRENFNGLLYTPGDCLDLARKIKFVIDNPELARQMGENGRRWAREEFSVTKYAGKVLQLLQEAVHQPGK
jgi:glycosyltransferase involved in cell wall biosynthesis